VSRQEPESSEALRQRYQWLLLAYPRWYRRERGLEILTTLLDAAAAGQRWPAAREAADIIGRGVWCRLRPPRPVYLVAFVPVSLFAAFTAAAVAIWLALTLFAPVPTDEVAAAVARAATGQAPRDLPGPAASCNDVYCHEQWSPGGDQVVTEDRPFYDGNHLDAVVVGYWIADDDMPGWIDNARRRLAADGWSLGPLTTQEDGFRGFAAETPELQLRMSAFPSDPGGPTPPLMYPRAAVVVQSKAPAGLSTLSGVAFAVGLLIGWLLTGRVVRRLGRRPSRANIFASSGLVAVGLAGLVDGLLLIGSVADVAHAATNGRAPLTELLMAPTSVTFPVLEVPAAMAALAALVTLVGTRPRRAGDSWRPIS